jgi:pimeloyl-ACP methyl ester carboxylesterase
VARLVFLGPVPPRAGDLWARYGATLEQRLTPAEVARLGDLEAAMIHGADPRQACRAYWAIGVKPRIDRPELASRVTGDFCSAPPEAIRSGMGVAGPHTLESLGAWDFRSGLAKVTAPTLIIHGEADAIRWTWWRSGRPRCRTPRSCGSPARRTSLTSSAPIWSGPRSSASWATTRRDRE